MLEESFELFGYSDVKKFKNLWELETESQKVMSEDLSPSLSSLLCNGGIHTFVFV